ncbi:hypothetical protein SAMN02745206_03442 [Desulfacinum infernum DSM 9756]|nr:hypothetical protein [Desulfacinum infernum]SHG19698.1 hypothetical protein SAMN02745206_03442 [Desulfacinum infernum DSM 9756]
MEKVTERIRQMPPDQALRALLEALREVLPRAGEEARTAFVMELLGESGDDRVSSLVHL